MPRAEERLHFPAAWHICGDRPERLLVLARDQMDRQVMEHLCMHWEWRWFALPAIICERPKVTCHPSNSSWIRIRSCDLDRPEQCSMLGKGGIRNLKLKHGPGRSLNLRPKRTCRDLSSQKKHPEFCYLFF